MTIFLNYRFWDKIVNGSTLNVRMTKSRLAKKHFLIRMSYLVFATTNISTKLWDVQSRLLSLSLLHRTGVSKYRRSFAEFADFRKDQAKKKISYLPRGRNSRTDLARTNQKHLLICQQMMRPDVCALEDHVLSLSLSWPGRPWGGKHFASISRHLAFLNEVLCGFIL